MREEVNIGATGTLIGLSIVTVAAQQMRITDLTTQLEESLQVEIRLREEKDVLEELVQEYASDADDFMTQRDVLKLTLRVVDIERNERVADIRRLEQNLAQERLERVALSNAVETLKVENNEMKAAKQVQD